MVAFCGVRRTPMLLVIFILVISLVVTPILMGIFHKEEQYEKRPLEHMSKTQMHEYQGDLRKLELEKIKNRHMTVKFDELDVSP